VSIVKTALLTMRDELAHGGVIFISNKQQPKKKAAGKSYGL